MRLKARPEYLRLVREYLAAFLKVFVPKSLSEETRYTTTLALQEACTNIIRYAFPEGSDEFFHITFRYEDEILQVEIVDEGKPYDPDNAEDPDLKECSEGGYGLYLIKKTMDSLQYKREGGRNYLLLTKNFRG